MAIRTEDFTGGAGAMPNPPWTNAALESAQLFRDGSGFGVVSGFNSALDALIYDNASTYPNDQVARITIVTGLLANNNNYAQAAVRCSSTGATFNGYTVYTDGGSGSTHTGLGKYVTGTQTILSETGTPSFTNGDELGASIQGSTFNLLKNNSIAKTVTDSSLSTGAAGCGASHYAGTSITIDNFIGDSLAASAAVTGTATSGITEVDIVAGGKTIIITLTGDTWILN